MGRSGPSHKVRIVSLKGRVPLRNKIAIYHIKKKITFISHQEEKPKTMKFCTDMAGVEKFYQDCPHCKPPEGQKKEVPEIFREILL